MMYSIFGIILFGIFLILFIKMLFLKKEIEKSIDEIEEINCKHRMEINLLKENCKLQYDVLKYFKKNMKKKKR